MTLFVARDADGDGKACLKKMHKHFYSWATNGEYCWMRPSDTESDRFQPTEVCQGGLKRLFPSLQKGEQKRFRLSIVEAVSA